MRRRLGEQLFTGILTMEVERPEEATLAVNGGKLAFDDNKNNSETAAYIQSWVANIKKENGVKSPASDDGNMNDLTFEIVSTRTVDNPNDKKHVAYTIIVKKPFGAEDPYPSVIERRYTDFLTLFMCLRQSFPAAFASFNFPKKLLMGNFSPESITARSNGFKAFFSVIAKHHRIRESIHVMSFLQDKELKEIKSLIEEKRFDQAITIVENCFRLLNKLHTDRHPSVLRTLCLLVACCEAGNDINATSFADLALHRYEAVSDTDLLRYYVPLLKICVKIYSSTEKEKDRTILLEDRLSNLKRQGIRVDGLPPLLKIVMADIFPS